MTLTWKPVRLQPGEPERAERKGIELRETKGRTAFQSLRNHKRYIHERNANILHAWAVEGRTWAEICERTGMTEVACLAAAKKAYPKAWPPPFVKPRKGLVTGP